MIEIGDFVPQRLFSDPANKAWSLYRQDVAGDQIGLCLLRQPDPGAVRAELDKFCDIHDRFAAVQSRLFAVTGQPVESDRKLAGERTQPFPALSDVSGETFADFGIGDNETSPAAVVLDCNLRLAAVLRAGGTTRLAVPARTSCRKLFEAMPDGTIADQAPVPLIPDLFDSGLCKRLIAHRERGEKRANEISRAEDESVAKPHLAGGCVYLNG